MREKESNGAGRKRPHGTYQQSYEKEPGGEFEWGAGYEGRMNRKLKYQKLEDNWGEGDVEPVEMRDHMEPLETSLVGSKVPNEGSLRQTSIREILQQERPTFRNPADRPTMLEQADHGSNRNTMDNPGDPGSMTKHRQTPENMVTRVPTIRSLGGRFP